MVRLPKIQLSCLLLLLPAAAWPLHNLQGQARQQPPASAAAQFDPSDVYFQGFMEVRKAEDLEAAGDYVGAAEKLRRAAKLFAAVQTYFPQWKPAVVTGRQQKTTESIARVEEKAQAQLQKNRNQLAELEGGVTTPVQPGRAGRSPEVELPQGPALSPLRDASVSARRLAEAEGEVQRLRNQLAEAKANQSRRDTASRDASRIRDLSAQRDALQANLKAAESQLQALRARANAAPPPPSASPLRVDPIVSRRLADAEAEVQRLRDQLAAEAKANQSAQDTASRDASRIRDLSAQRDALQSDLKAAENQVQALRARLATAPLVEELQGLNQKIQQLEQEREAMGLALSQSRSAHTESLAKIATLEADLRNANQKIADLNRDLGAERQTANAVVAGQRRQLDALQKELQSKNQELSQANQRIQQLSDQLEQSQAAFSQLRQEHSTLLQERDQMAALLKLNEAGRIQELIEQNLALAKTLREAKENVDRLNRESNADKDAYTDALRDLAIAKSQIHRMHQEKRDQDQRIAELENRLKQEQQALAEGKASADPAEVETLREIINKQLRAQERRRQARDLLVDAARQLGKQDPQLAQAIELFDGADVALTPEEQKLIAHSKVDGEFVSPFARDRETVGRATDALKTDIGAFERTAEKSYLAGRLLPTREIYQMILEQFPNHTPSLCKLGVVHLRLNEAESAVDCFRRAVEMDGQNAYAHRMLGVAMMQMSDLTGAESAVRRAVDLAPTESKNLMLLGAVCYRLGRAPEAESYFKAAINADPLPSEPYFNLALINQRAGRNDKARQFYQQALERGAKPDPKLEDALAKP